MAKYSNSSKSTTRGHRYHSRRKRARKLSLLSLVLGVFCVIISVVFALYAIIFGNRQAEKYYLIAAGYFAIGLLLLLVRWIFEIIRNRKPRKQYYPGQSSAEFFDPTPSTKQRDGAALIVILGVLATVAVLIFRAQVSAHRTHRHERGALLETRLQTAAADAARSALLRLAADEDLMTDHTNEAWSITEEATDPSGITTYTTVTDQNRYFDFNNAAATLSGAGRPPADVIMDIMTLCGDFSPVQRVDALTDWVDDNEQGLVEAGFYQENAPPYTPPDRPLLSWTELLHVAGFSRDLFERHPRTELNEMYNADLIDCFSIVPASRTRPLPVNINTAGRDVLLGVLGMDQEAAVRGILVMRVKEPVRDLASILMLVPKELAERVSPYLDVKSNVFEINSLAYLDGRTERLHALARRDGEGNVDVLQWVF